MDTSENSLRALTINWMINLLTSWLTPSGRQNNSEGDMISEYTLAYALSFLGSPYLYGGQGPNGVDCSGFVILVLQAEGRLPNKFDASAQGLFDFFKINGAIESKIPKKGCLAFYGSNIKEITHVGICLSGLQIIEAAGGDSTTTTIDAANKRGAHVRIRPVDYRKDLVAFLAIDVNSSKVLSFPKGDKKELQ